MQWFFKYIHFISTQQATLVKKPLISESWLNYINYQDIYFKDTEKNQSTLVRCLWHFYNLTPTFYHSLSSRESVPHTLLWTRMGWWLLWPIKYGRNVTMWLLRLSLRGPCRFCFLLLGRLLSGKRATMVEVTSSKKAMLERPSGHSPAEIPATASIHCQLCGQASLGVPKSCVTTKQPRPSWTRNPQNR